MLRFIHITDTHIGSTPHYSLYGKRPLDYLNRVVNRINDLPFDVDFVLHTGDCVDDAKPESYGLFKEAISKLRFPIKFVVGNHDHVDHLQTIVMGEKSPLEKLDYAFEIKGIKWVVLDTRGPSDPGGQVTPKQLDWLKSQCTPDGPPMVIAMHHMPIKLDTPWLDESPPGWSGRYMFISNAEEIVSVLKPAAARIRGVFTGHVHGSYLSQTAGILFCAGQSTFAPLSAYPNSNRVANDEEQRPMFNIVSVTDTQVIIRPRSFELSR